MNMKTHSWASKAAELAKLYRPDCTSTVAPFFITARLYCTGPDVKLQLRRKDHTMKLKVW